MLSLDLRPQGEAGEDDKTFRNLQELRRRIYRKANFFFFFFFFFFFLAARQIAPHDEELRKAG